MRHFQEGNFVSLPYGNGICEASYNKAPYEIPLFRANCPVFVLV